MKSFCLNGLLRPAREMALDGQNRLPAILVECGFLTNPAEAARITDSHSRERLARAIADAILGYV